MKFYNYDNFKIHIKDKLSWSPIDSEYGLIKNGNIKDKIKYDIDNIYKNIQDQYNNFKIFENISVSSAINGYDQLYGNLNALTPPHIMHYHKIRHELALDNASCILNYDKLVYVGSLRNIIFKTPNIYNEFINILNLKNEDKLILYLLSSPLVYNTINAFADQYIYERYIKYNDIIDHTDIINYMFNNPHHHLVDTNQYLIDMRYYLKLAFIAIQYPDKFNAINFFNNDFARKWHELYIQMNKKIYHYGYLICTVI